MRKFVILAIAVTAFTVSPVAFAPRALARDSGADARNAVHPGERPRDKPVSGDPAANAGAAPMADARTFEAFHGREGIDRIVSDAIDRSAADPRISDVFKSFDLVRLKRTLAEQFCFLLDGGCTYTGADMKTVHADMGLQTADLTALIENLQWAMDKEGVPFAAQNRLLGKLAPMKRDVVTR